MSRAQMNPAAAFTELCRVSTENHGKVRCACARSHVHINTRIRPRRCLLTSLRLPTSGVCTSRAQKPGSREICAGAMATGAGVTPRPGCCYVTYQRLVVGRIRVLRQRSAGASVQSASTRVPAERWPNSPVQSASCDGLPCVT